MKVSKESQPQFNLYERESLSDSIGQLTTFQKVLDQDDCPTNFINTFIEKKCGQVMNLQNYLVQQLQYIQNCKERNKKIEQKIFSTILPALLESKKAFQTIKSILKLIGGLAVNYVQAIGQKSYNLLIEKQEKCKSYQKQIANLRQQASQLKAKIYNQMSQIDTRVTPQKFKTEELKKIKQQIKQKQLSKEKQQLLIEYHNNERDLSKKKEGTKSFRNLAQDISPHKQLTMNKRELSNFGNGNSSSDKLRKHEQYYKNILENKKVNISYKCQKSPIKSKIQLTSSASKATQNYYQNDRKISRPQFADSIGNRKQLIKQKIEKLKIKAECRQFQKQSFHKQKVR